MNPLIVKSRKKASEIHDFTYYKWSKNREIAFENIVIPDKRNEVESDQESLQ